LPDQTPKAEIDALLTDTPEAKTPDPKASTPPATGAAAAAPPGAQPGPTKTDSAEPAGSKPGSPAEPAKPKAETDIEAKLQKLGEEDLRLKEERKAFETEKEKLRKHEALLKALESGDEVAIARAALGSKYSLESLTKIANDPELTKPKAQPSVEDAVKAALEAERAAAKAKEEEDAKKQAEAAQKQLEESQAAYLTEIKTFIKANAAKYPLTTAWDDDPDTDNESIAIQELEKHYNETLKTTGKGEILTPEQVAAAVEARHLAKVKKTPFAPKEKKEITFDDEIAAIKNRVKPAENQPPRKKTVYERALALLEEGEDDSKNTIRARA
jgi:multidrug efflux pump subunit AcrA (membrane-fusion protein)